jgi:hypothetical protein
MATETLAFLCEMPKSHDLGHVHGHVIRMSKLPKIAKIDSVRPAVPQHLHENPLNLELYARLDNEIR